jgi:hypothetical protein
MTTTATQCCACAPRVNNITTLDEGIAPCKAALLSRSTQEPPTDDLITLRPYNLTKNNFVFGANITSKSVAQQWALAWLLPMRTYLWQNFRSHSYAENLLSSRMSGGITSTTFLSNGNTEKKTLKYSWRTLTPFIHA